MVHPLAVTPCNMDMEGLINDSNRSIATLAITTLLKTGSESGVDRLMKQITSFMSEIADEFKIVVVDAIRAMCLKFPQKHRVLMSFLSNVLREEGGFPYKRAIVDTILVIIAKVPEAKEAGLGHLCEFIEDCEFTYLSVQILNLLGQDGPHTHDPTRYIRYVYNRVILENATVRAAAVSALAKFGVHCEALRDRVIVLVRRCLFDNDDEVRDRAMLSLSLLEAQTEEAHSLITEGLPVSFAAVERALETHQAAGAATPFFLASVKELTGAAAPAPVTKPQILGGLTAPAPAAGGAPETSTKKEKPAHTVLHGIPEFAGFGKCFKSSPPVPLTEQETEYVVVCTKHIFAKHIVFQFNCNNTIENTCLENANMAMETGDEGFEEEANVPCAEPLMCNEPGNMFVAFALDDEQPNGSFTCQMKFLVKDVDEASGEPDEEGYDDEYQVEEVEVTAADYVRPAPAPNFREAWTSMEEPFEVREQFNLDAPSIQEAVTGVIDKLALAACEGTHRVPEGADQHDLLMSGLGMSGNTVLVRAVLRFAQGRGCMMRIMVRSVDGELAAAIAGLC